MGNLLFQPLKVLNLHCDIVFDPQIGIVGTYHEGSPPIKSQDPLIYVVLRDNVTNLQHISPTRIRMAITIARMVTYLEGPLPIESLDPLVVWFCKITWQTKAIIFPLPHWHQTWRDGDLTWRTATHKATQNVGHVVM